MKRFAVILLLAAALPAQAQQEQKASHNAVVIAADAIEWMAPPPVLPAGAKLAVLQGNPGEAGPFVIRLSFPANYTIAPHSHPTDEIVTVVSGKLNFGMGDKLDKSNPKSLTAGGFAVLPAGMNHFAFTTEETVVQIHGEGPFAVKYANPADDPSKK